MIGESNIYQTEEILTRIDNDIQNIDDSILSKKFKRISVNNNAIMMDTQGNLRRWLDIMRTNFEI